MHHYGCKACGVRIRKPGTTKAALRDRLQQYCRACGRSRWRRRRRYRPWPDPDVQLFHKREWETDPGLVLLRQIRECVGGAKRLPQDDRHWKYHPVAARFRRLMRAWWSGRVPVSLEALSQIRIRPIHVNLGHPAAVHGPRLDPTLEQVWATACERVGAGGPHGYGHGYDTPTLEPRDATAIRELGLACRTHVQRLKVLETYARQHFVDGASWAGARKAAMIEGRLT